MSNKTLIYYPDSEPGITRLRHGRGFRYVAADGTSIDDETERKRIKALAVPPAYDEVWICPLPEGHLQATGRDARRRKQYRYHPDWRAVREADKFDGLADFGRALPKIRRRILADLNEEPGDRDYAIAAILALLDRVAIRVGHDSYAKENGTVGATTLRPRNVDLDGNEIRLRYQAKGGRKIRRNLTDATLATMLDAMHDLPGGKLITWQDETGTSHDVTSDMVNARLAELTGLDGATAKTFRTWAGSEAALEQAMRAETPTIKALAQAAADRLGNTPAIARKSYIHPKVIALAQKPNEAVMARLERAEQPSGMRKIEAALLSLID